MRLIAAGRSERFVAARNGMPFLQPELGSDYNSWTIG